MEATRRIFGEKLGELIAKVGACRELKAPTKFLASRRGAKCFLPFYAARRPKLFAEATPLSSPTLPSTIRYGAHLPVLSVSLSLSLSLSIYLSFTNQFLASLKGILITFFATEVTIRTGSSFTGSWGYACRGWHGPPLSLSLFSERSMSLLLEKSATLYSFIESFCSLRRIFRTKSCGLCQSDNGYLMTSYIRQIRKYTERDTFCR